MLDEAALLAPVSETHPAGEDLAFSPEFDRIIECRRADDPTLDQGAWQTDMKSADWAGVRRTCDTLLRQRTKDLRLAGWLAESCTQLEGLPGLAAGLRVMAGLCERYWMDVHPMASGDDNDERVGNLSWLLTNAINWVRAVPIMSAPQGHFSLADHEHANSRLHAESAGRAGQHDVTPTAELLAAARRDTPHAFYRALLDALLQCNQALGRLQAIIDQRLGEDGPSFTPLREQLEILTRTSERFAREAGLLLEGTYGALGARPSTRDAQGDQVELDTIGIPQRPSSPLVTRRDALVQLRQVAEFFRMTEPHSPVAYLAEKAANWGEMPLHVWLARVIKDPATLSQMRDLLDAEEPPAS